MILFDYIGNRACEEAEKKFNEYLKRDELQKILLQCFIDARMKTDDSIKRKIYKVKSEKIKPNMSKEEIKNNLQELFHEIIDNNEDYDGDSENMKDYICYEYLKRAREKILELCHIMDVLDNVKTDIIKLIKDGEKQQETLKKVDELHTELLKRRGNKIHFIEELDTSRVFFYCEIEICTYYQGIEETLEEIFEELGEETIPCFEYQYTDNEYFQTILITFIEPVIQYEFRNFLKYMNALFTEEEILISSITTHF